MDTTPIHEHEPAATDCEELLRRRIAKYALYYQDRLESIGQPRNETERQEFGRCRQRLHFWQSNLSGWRDGPIVIFPIRSAMRPSPTPDQVCWSGQRGAKTAVGMREAMTRLDEKPEPDEAQAPTGKAHTEEKRPWRGARADRSDFMGRDA